MSARTYALFLQYLGHAALDNLQPLLELILRNSQCRQYFQHLIVGTGRFDDQALFNSLARELVRHVITSRGNQTLNQPASPHAKSSHGIAMNQILEPAAYHRGL